MLNKVRDLRDGRSLWQDSARSGTRHRTKLPAETCDVAVIGAGVSGALIALHLADAGHDVVVVDRREPISGSTSASTALIQFEIDTPFIELSEKIGAARAARAYRRSYAAVKDLAQLIPTPPLESAMAQAPRLVSGRIAPGIKSASTRS